MTTEPDVRAGEKVEGKEPDRHDEPGRDSNTAYWANMFEQLRPLREVVRKIEEHPWIVAGYVSVLLTIQLMAVAHGDAATAASILASGGFTGVANVIVLVVLPLSSMTLFCVATLTAFGVWGARGWKEVWPCMLIVLGLLIPPLILIPREVLGIIAGLTFAGSIFLALWNRFRRSKTVSPGVGSGGRLEFAAILIVALVASPLSAALKGDIWLPAEVFSVNSKPVTGYLLSNENDEALVLLDKHRGTIIIPSKDVGNRERCSLPLTGAPLWTLLGEPAKYPACPSP